MPGVSDSAVITEVDRRIGMVEQQRADGEAAQIMLVGA